MPIFEWDESFSVNVKSIDMQHKVLVDMINTYHDAVIHKESFDALMRLLNGLEMYTVKHFSLEEKYFDKFGYRDSIQHKKIHEDLKKKIKGLKDKAQKDKALLSVEVSQFLKDWLFNHIKGTDKKYSDFFNENGLT